MEVPSLADVKLSHSLVVPHGSILGFDSSLCWFGVEHWFKTPGIVPCCLPGAGGKRHR